MAYAFPSTCWALLALTTLWVCGLERIRSWFNKRLSVMAALIALFQILLLMNVGLFTGFGRSPYSFTPIGISINLIVVSSTLLGTELSRAYLIKNLGKKKPLLTLGLTTLLYAFINISLIGFLNLLTIKEPLRLADFIGTKLLPAVSENFLASYLTLLAGPIASLAYRAPLQAFQWFLPILPNLPWGFEALLGVMPPTLGLLYINQLTTPTMLRRIGIFTETKGFHRPAKVRKSSLMGWMTISILCVLVVWTTTGLLGFYPTIIASGSMRPAMDVGDVAIIVGTPIEKIRQGDIIQYWREREMVIHRVFDIHQTGGYKLFVTKGDANQGPDREPVLPSQIKGKLIFIMPKLGWISIYVKTTIAGIWSFLSAKILLAYATLAITAFMASIYMVHAHKSRSTRRWKSLHRKTGWPRR